MDANSFIEFMKLPFWERVAGQRSLLEEEAKKGTMVGRVGVAPIDTRQVYHQSTGSAPRSVLMFGSNSYLNMNHHPSVINKVIAAAQTYGIGSGGSPAFSGYTSQHKALETRLAALAGHEDAMLLPTGYMANLAWVNGLMTRDDVLLYDKHSHASVINAIKMTGVTFYPYNPDDLPGFLRLIEDVRARHGKNKQLFATVEGVRSIDGSIIDLREFVKSCKDQSIFLILDDAHGLGVLGAHGRGTLEHLDMQGAADVRMSTCSKALGAQGAFLSGRHDVIAYMRTMAKPYTFTTALALTTVAAIEGALDVLEQEPDRLKRLHSNRRYLEDRLLSEGFNLTKTETGIVPVYFRDGIAGSFNRILFSHGLFVNTMEYPMVSPGSERLRFSLQANHTPEEIDEAVSIMKTVYRQFQ